MTKKFTNVETYLIVIFLFLLLIVGINQLGKEAILNENSNLDNDSLEYIANLNKINLSDYNINSQDIISSSVTGVNESQGTPKDYSIEFFFAKQKGLTFEVTIKAILSLPEVLLIDLLRFNLNDWIWAINLFNWLYRLLIILAIYYLIRGILT